MFPQILFYSLIFHKENKARYLLLLLLLHLHHLHLHLHHILWSTIIISFEILSPLLVVQIAIFWLPASTPIFFSNTIFLYESFPGIKGNCKSWPTFLQLSKCKPPVIRKKKNIRWESPDKCKESVRESVQGQEKTRKPQSQKNRARATLKMWQNVTDWHIWHIWPLPHVNQSWHALKSELMAVCFLSGRCRRKIIHGLSFEHHLLHFQSN